MRKIFYSWTDVEHMVNSINNLMFQSEWKPDYIVGLTRGGLTPAVIMSNITGIPMYTLDVRFRDVLSDYEIFGRESNKKMATQALSGKKILIIDDINDSGQTLKWIRQDWEETTASEMAYWDNVWGESVRVATLVDNMGSNFDSVDYTAVEIDKRDNPAWIVFPWEGEKNFEV
jgi:hypoxanthine phosphoribosyltransferase